MHEVRRLLERLQQPVGHLVVHRVHALQHEHPAGRLERRAGGRRHHGLVHVLHAHHVRAARPHPGQVGVGAVLHAQAHRVGVGLPLGEQLGGERARHRALAGAGRRRGTGRRARGPPPARRTARCAPADGPRCRPARRSRARPAARRLDLGQHLARAPRSGGRVGVDRAASGPGPPRPAARRPRAPPAAAPRPRPRSGRSRRRAAAAATGSISSRKVRSGTRPPVAKRLMRSTSSTPRPRAPPW